MRGFLNRPRTIAGALTGSATGLIQASRSASDEEPPPAWMVRAATSLLLFVLLREWLLPLAYVAAWTDLTRVDIIIYSVAYALLCGTMVLSWKRLPLVLAVGLGLAVPWLYYGTGEPVSWLPRLAAVFLEDARTLMAGESVLSAELRTTLLLGGCMSLSCAMQSLMWLRGWGAGVAVATGLFVLNLEWWFGIDAFLPMLRVIAAGGLLTVLLTYSRAVQDAVKVVREAMVRQSGWPLRWLVAGALAVTALLGAGWWAASERPAPDGPAPWAAHWQEQGEVWLRHTMQREAGARYTAAPAGSTTAAEQAKGQVGYGEDDSRLGTPLAPDGAVMFTAYATAPVMYWRGEAKTFYDGSGWHAPAEGRRASPLDLPYGDERKLEGANGSVEEGLPQAANSYIEPVRVKLVYVNPQAGLPLFTAGIDSRVLRVDAGSERQISYERDQWTDSLFPARKRLAVTVAELESRSSQLSTGVGMTGGDQAGSRRSPLQEPQARKAIRDALQLPEGVTERTVALARSVTESAGKDRYARALALEQYLRESFRYTLRDTTVPGEGQDFVDHFLFDQRAGYCVHFASAMTVMLRTLDIPARWVKGFASPTTKLELSEAEPGTAVTPSGEEKLISYGYRAEVRQQDAHAWVEVYVEGSGWVRFDPTPPATVGTVVAAEGVPGNGAAENLGAGQDGAGTTGSSQGAVARWSASLELAGAWTVQYGALGLQVVVEHALYASQQLRGALVDDLTMGSNGAVLWVVLTVLLLLTGSAVLIWRRRVDLALALAFRGYRRASQGERLTRRGLLVVIGRVWRLVERMHGERPSHCSGSEYVDSLQVTAPFATCLLALVRWEEEARYAAGDWCPPGAEELRAVMAGLRAEVARRRSRRALMHAASTGLLSGRSAAER